MAAVIRLDTHVVAWLHAGEIQRLSPDAASAIESSALVISPMVELELTYLFEIGRLTVTGQDIVTHLRDQIGVELSPLALDAVVRGAGPMSWTRDPFDRLITADAAASGSRLVTKDDTIHEHYPDSLW